MYEPREQFASRRRDVTTSDAAHDCAKMATAEARNRLDRLRQRLLLSVHHYSVTLSLAAAAAAAAAAVLLLLLLLPLCVHGDKHAACST